MVREGFLEEETCALRKTPEGDNWAKIRRKAVPGRRHREARAYYIVGTGGAVVELRQKG